MSKTTLPLLIKIFNRTLLASIPVLISILIYDLVVNDVQNWIIILLTAIISYLSGYGINKFRQMQVEEIGLDLSSEASSSIFKSSDLKQVLSVVSLRISKKEPDFVIQIFTDQHLLQVLPKGEFPSFYSSTPGAVLLFETSQEYSDLLNKYEAFLEGLGVNYHKFDRFSIVIDLKLTSFIGYSYKLLLRILVEVFGIQSNDQIEVKLYSIQKNETISLR